MLLIVGAVAWPNKKNNVPCMYKKLELFKDKNRPNKQFVVNLSCAFTLICQLTKATKQQYANNARKFIDRDRKNRLIVMKNI